jgi:hypothetical protein
MKKIPANDIDQLIMTIKDSIRYKSFFQRQLCPKIRREKNAWDLIVKYKDRYTENAFLEIINTVDLSDKNNQFKRWFGYTFHPNRNLKEILENSNDTTRNLFMEKLLFSGYSSDTALDICLRRPIKISYLGNSAASVFLYLSDSEHNNVFSDTHQRALYKIEFVINEKIKNSNFGEQFRIFNNKVIEFRKKYEFKPAEVDYVLSFIGYQQKDKYGNIIKEYIKKENGYFLVDEDALYYNEFGFLPIDMDCQEINGDFLPQKGPVTIVIPEGPIPKPDKKMTEIELKSRREKHKLLALQKAGYKCEINRSHESFINRKNNKNFVEGHHLIPLEFEEHFKYDVDVPEDIISLCPNCHKMLHNAKAEIIKPYLKKLYNERINLLIQRGLFIPLEKLFMYYFD